MRFEVTAKYYSNSASDATWCWLQNIRNTAIHENAGKFMTSVLTPFARDYLILAYPLGVADAGLLHRGHRAAADRAEQRIAHVY